MFCFLALSGLASATTVTVDGILSSDEYIGGVEHGSKSLSWYNNHHSIYGLGMNNGNDFKNDLVWEINKTNDLYSLNLFFEVPTYARRMVWETGVDYNGDNWDSQWQLDPTYVEAYLTGAKDEQPNGDTHHDNIKMDFETQTGSEYFQLNGIPKDNPGLKIEWVNKIKNDKGKKGKKDKKDTYEINRDMDFAGDNFIFKTSLAYLFDEGLCNTGLCQQYAMTAAIEMMWKETFNSLQDAKNFKNSISSMELHLSDEARGLPDITNPNPNPVPEPSTMVLLGFGILGLAGYSRKKHQK